MNIKPEAQARFVKKYDTKASLSPNKLNRPPTTSDSNSNTYSTGFTKGRVSSKQNQLPEIARQSKRKQENFVQSQEFLDILLVEKDERYRYLVKHGTIRRIENGGNIIFSELSQIPGIWVCYRRPNERSNNPEKLCLDNLDLSHMPLLEGEEKLKILTYQHNRIPTIQNLVSLPNLLYLDLYDNQIKEIEELKQIAKLKVLLMPKNQIRKIQNLDHFSKLEVLDLHSNRIVCMEGMSKLKSLKILNLGNNLIQKIENLEELTSLLELNLKINQIETIDNLAVVPQLQKLYLTSNKVQQFPPALSLLELSLESNPLSVNRSDYLRMCVQLYEFLKLLDGKPFEAIRQEVQLVEPKTEPLKKKSLANTMPPQTIVAGKKKVNQIALEIHGIASEFRPKDEVIPFSQLKKESGAKDTVKEKAAPVEEDVKSLIKGQWSQEFSRVQALERQNQLTKKSCLEHIKVEGGHAEVEDDEFLQIFGTASAMVIPQQNFYDTIEKIHFQYVLFDNLIDSQMHNLKKYRKLRELIFKDNYINSLLQLAKLEHLQDIRALSVANNPINNCSFLFQFLVYRFPALLQINGKEIRSEDKLKAKQWFQNFDKSLQIPERLQNCENIRQLRSHQKDKNFVKAFHKASQEVAQEQKLVFKSKKQFVNAWDEYMSQLIAKCKSESK